MTYTLPLFQILENSNLELKALDDESGSEFDYKNEDNKAVIKI